MNTLRRHVTALWAALLTLALITAGLVSAGGAATAAAKEPKADPNGTLQAVSTLAPTTWDPVTIKSPGAWRIFAFMVYDRLLDVADTPTGTQVAPMLAKSWTLSNDGLTLEMKLRDDVKFQDGTAFNADAVKANIERAKTTAGSTAAPLLTSVDTVEVVNPTTVKFHLNKKDPSLLFSLSDTPGMMVSPAAFSPNLERTPVGSGPYKLTSQTNTAATFDRWDGGWDKTRGLAKTVVLTGVADINARLNLLQSGQINVANLSPTQFQQADDLNTSKQYDFTLGCSPLAYLLEMNSNHPPFDNVDVRRAISMAIDRDTIQKTLLPFNPSTQQIYLKGFEGYDAALDQKIPFNVKKATDMIDKAGAKGATMNVIYPATDPYTQLATVIQEQLGKIGINFQAQGVPASQTPGEWAKGTADAALNAFSGSFDPALQLQAWLAPTHNTNPSQIPKDIATLSAKAGNQDPGSKAQNSTYQDVSKSLVDSPLHIPLFQYCTGFSSSPNVLNLDAAMRAGTISWVDFSKVGVAKTP